MPLKTFKQFSYFVTLFIGLVCNQAFTQSQKHFLVTDYGAIGDGKTLNTSAIQKAIDLAHQSNSGKVIIPEGTFLTGTLEIKSNVELHLKQKGVLLGSINPSHYRSLEMKGRPQSPKQDDNSQLALIVAFEANNIAISGQGTIDGQGRELALAVDSLHHAGIVIDPDYSTRSNRPNEKMRPKLVRLSTCTDVKFSQTSFRNSACWGLSFELCTNLSLDSLTIYNRAYWNNDGMDITDSQNVRVTNCDVNSADDGICLKSYYPGHSNDGIFISNCTIRSGASAIKFGTASYGGFKNVTINNIKIFDTFRSALALESVDGGVIENINISNIVALNTGNAIFIRLGHRDGVKPGIVRNINVKNIKVQVPFGRPDIDYDIRARQPSSHHNPFSSSIVGIPGHPIENVQLKNIEISYPGRASKGQAYIPLHRLSQVPEKIKDYPEFSMFGELPAWAMYLRHTKGISMKNISLKLEDLDFRPAIIFDDAQGVSLKNIEIPKELKQKQIVFKDSNSFKIDPKGGEQLIVID